MNERTVNVGVTNAEHPVAEIEVPVVRNEFEESGEGRRWYLSREGGVVDAGKVADRTAICRRTRRSGKRILVGEEIAEGLVAVVVDSFLQEFEDSQSTFQVTLLDLCVQCTMEEAKDCCAAIQDVRRDDLRAAR